MKKIFAVCLLLCTLLGACRAERKPAVQLFTDRDAVDFKSGYLFDVNGDGTPEFCCNAWSSYEGYFVQWVVVMDYGNGKKYRLCDDFSQVDETHGPDRYYLEIEQGTGELYVAKRAYNAESRDYKKVTLSIEAMQEIEE